MNKKSFLWMFVLLCFVFNSYADSGSVIYEQGENISLYQICDSCTFVNLESVILPSGEIVYLNSSMVKTGFSYTYNWSNTSELGEYFYFVCGDKSDVLTCETLSFFVSANGEGFSTSNSLMYAILIFVFIIFFVVSLFFAIVTDGENKFTMGPEGERLVEVNSGMYVKLFLYLLSYLFFWILSWIIWQVSTTFLPTSNLLGVLRILFIVETILWVPIFLIVAVIGIMKHITDSEILNLNKRGLMPR